MSFRDRQNGRHTLLEYHSKITRIIIKITIPIRKKFLKNFLNYKTEITNKFKK